MVPPKEGVSSDNAALTTFNIASSATRFYAWPTPPVSRCSAEYTQPFELAQNWRRDKDHLSRSNLSGGEVTST